MSKWAEVCIKEVVIANRPMRWIFQYEVGGITLTEGDVSDTANWRACIYPRGVMPEDGIPRVAYKWSVTFDNHDISGECGSGMTRSIYVAMAKCEALVAVEIAIWERWQGDGLPPWAELYLTGKGERKLAESNTKGVE